MKKESEGGKPEEGKKSSSTPSISLPKGGGAIRGIGEKFAANPVTGTGSLSVPIATSPGRSGFSPALSLNYDSGSGNGPFGFGWNLPLPSITRKTDKGLPKYRDGDESDTFILSGAEDLVPVLKKQGNDWVPEEIPDRTIGTDKYRIKRYRPRIEGLYARVERWTNTRKNETHWRSISKDNIVTVYGRTTNSRIEDPNAPEGSPRAFSWLICESYDDKGNAIFYEYESEDPAGIDLSQANERNRTDKSRSANRYLKRIKYGNKTPVEHDSNLPREFGEDISKRTDWLFEVVFDYEEGHVEELPADSDGRQFVNAYKNPTRDWQRRKDPHSRYRSGFEVRTYRLCHRVLMFHHFTNELGVDDYLVRSTGFKYKEGPIASFITSIKQSGYKLQDDGAYLKKFLPPVELEYSEATIQDKVQDIDEESIENLPQGLDGAQYQWADIDGEGLSGILTEQGDSWFYKRNVSAIPVVGKDGKPQVIARFAPTEQLATIPSFTNLSDGRQQLVDLGGDGQLDVVEFDSPTPGFFERTKDEAWHIYRPFVSLPNISWQDPNLKFVDLTGDGHADIFITEDDAFTWYPSLAEIGFAPGEKVRQALDEDKGPKLVFADGTQSIYLADISGDGLTDLVRIRNGEICYWPNLGYGNFGAKVTMDNSPCFDTPDHFNQRRVRLADIDGSGVTDIIYLKDDGVYIYLNESGNHWADAKKLNSFPQIDSLSSVMVVDLLGNGTACLVWSSPLPGHACKPMRYIDLMGGQKPHLLVKTVNNLGAETHVHYAPSTKFYLADKLAGKPWITKIPFPVHVIERIETFDRISCNRFTTRYAYRHGYFDGVEREFRGFGMVEQRDTEEYAALSQGQDLPVGDNIEESSHVPPVLTKTWFHTGAYLGRNRISNFFAGLLDANDIGEYYREQGLTEEQARELLLEDTVLPDGLTVEEEREACRALKGSMLRQEVYALDGTGKEPHPYTVTEQNFTIRVLQAHGDNRHAVFFTHAREAINYHYERNPADPRIAHAITLEVDDFGNVLKEVAIGYGRRQPDMNLSAEDQTKQTQILATYTENRVTNAVDAADNGYRTPLPCETRTYELTGYTPTGAAGRFQVSDFMQPDPTDPSGRIWIHTFDGEVNYEDEPPNGKQRRIIEHLRILYRPDDLGVLLNDPQALLPLGTIEPLALPGESYKLALTPGLLAQVYQRSREGQSPEKLLPNPKDILPVDVSAGQIAGRGGYVDLDGDSHWWIPAGLVFHSPDTGDTAAQELARARKHFFLPHRYCDPFGYTSTVGYDGYDLLMVETRDPLGNRVTSDNDYRVLQPRLVTDPNRNRGQVAFDVLGMVVGTAVMGKPEENLGDSLDGFEPDLTDSVILDHLTNPLAAPHAIFGRAATRLAYDLFAYQRTEDQPDPQPAVVYTLARETHDADLEPGKQTSVQHSFTYSDGFGREIQKKIQAEPGPVPRRDATGAIMVGPDDQPLMTEDDFSPRWVGSGWTVFNNKGKPVRQYEPFFTDTHRFEFEVRIGVSPVLFYDPAERVLATLHPNHTYEKVVFNPWYKETWDVNDTASVADPKTDPDVGDFFRRLPDSDYLPTWYALRTDPTHAAEANQRWPDSKTRDAEKRTADKTSVHAATPTAAYADSLERTFLTIDHNKSKYSHTPPGDPPVEEFLCARVIFDIEGNQREVADAKGRVVMRYDYDMLGNRIHQLSMEASARWMLNDATGKPIRAWDSRGHDFWTEYDLLRRPLRHFVAGADHTNPNEKLLTERLVYGEQHPEADKRNLRAQFYLHLDQAGAATTEDYDFKGNPQKASRRIATEYKQTTDWSAVDAALPPNATTPLDPVLLEAALVLRLGADTFNSRTTYDALNRPVTLRTPDNSVIRPGYNEANFLKRVDANLGGATAGGQPVWTSFVTNIDYDAKGQRRRIDYGNGANTLYEYDPLTFRLVHLLTRRNAVAFRDDCPESPPIGWPGCQVQNLHYIYDPVGNITHIRDDAQQTIYFRNQRVDPSGEYTYDAIYRLIEATGREHLGQIGGAPVPHSHDDAQRVDLLHPGDGNAMGRSLERYLYDAIGNILEMQHRGSDPAHPGWTRSYDYSEPSLIEPVKSSNRLSCTTVGNNNPPVERYIYDIHGNMIRMPHLGDVHPVPNLHWDCRDQLHQADLGGGGKAYYVYDAAGQRVRKVWEKSVNLIEERIYLGGLEIFRRRNGAGAIALERETLHIMDDARRIALVETLTQGSDPAPQQLIRYQLGNHLGSASLELDDEAQIISYEEYTPYGSTSYQVVRSQTETPKRYRYTGKERDEESGLYYHGARHYAAWLGRWTSADPKGLEEGANFYAYVRNNPLVLNDPDGREARIVVDPTAHSVTISTTVHIYNNSRVPAGKLRRAIQKAQQFYNNPTVATDAQVTTATNNGTPIPSGARTFTDTSGQVWTINFNVRYQVHSSRTPPIRDISGSTGGRQLHRISRSGISTDNIQAGDNVLQINRAPAGSSVGGQVPLASIGSVNSNAVGEVLASRHSFADEIGRRIIHETGHCLGFDDRYNPQLATLLGNTYAGFDFDFMNAGGRAVGTPVVMNPRHVQEYGTFLSALLGSAATAGMLRGNNRRSHFFLSGHIDNTNGGNLQPNNRNYAATQTTNRQQRVQQVLQNTRARRQQLQSYISHLPIFRAIRQALGSPAPAGTPPDPARMLFPQVPAGYLNIVP